MFTVVLSDPQSPMTAMAGDYCGDGGIYGFISGHVQRGQGRQMGQGDVAANASGYRQAARPEPSRDERFGTLSSYLYGDEIMALRGGRPVGMPYCGGYACGYALIRHYLKKTGASVYEATVTPTGETHRRAEGFWG